METEKQIQEYLNAYVNPVMSQMLVDIIKERPKNILHYCKAWCQKKIEFHRTITQLDSDEDDEDTIDDHAFQLKKMRPRAQQRRNGVSGQTYGSSLHLTTNFQPKVIKKKGLIKNRILFRLKSTFMFGDLSEADYIILINAMEEVEVAPGATIIRQGESGEEVYILDEGELECYKIDEEGQFNLIMKQIKEGEMFGELSMLYNIPRTASIRAKRKSLLFKLDRKTFNFVLRNKNVAKRDAYCTAIDKVDIFRELTQAERDKLEDILRQMNVHSNQYVIREGRIGNKFYIVQKGQLVALKKNQNGTENVVYQYHDGDYFGELSLLSNKARAASIMALTNTRLLYIEREAFERIIGPMEHILQRNKEIYSKYIKHTVQEQ